METVKFFKDGVQFTFVKNSGTTVLYSGTNINLGVKPTYIGYAEYEGIEMLKDNTGATHIVYGDTNSTITTLYRRWLKETKLLRSLGMQF